MSLLQYEDFFYRGCKLHLDDPVAAWQALADRQQHWDLICDMRESGEICADGELFYRNGHFLTEIL